jgi:cold shock CspA family protein
MQQARVSFFNRLRGFGFAIPTDLSQPDCFIHVKNLPEDHQFVCVGDLIEYEAAPGIKGRAEALNIRIIESARGGAR